MDKKEAEGKIYNKKEKEEVTTRSSVVVEHPTDNRKAVGSTPTGSK